MTENKFVVGTMVVYYPFFERKNKHFRGSKFGKIIGLADNKTHVFVKWDDEIDARYFEIKNLEFKDKFLERQLLLEQEYLDTYTEISDRLRDASEALSAAAKLADDNNLVLQELDCSNFLDSLRNAGWSTSSFEC